MQLRSQRESLTASASIVTPNDLDAVRRVSMAYRTWQADAWSFYDCLDSDTEILTIDGWKTHDEVAVGTEVLTLDPDSGLSSWEPVLKVNRYEVTDEPMLSIETKRHSSLSTRGHRWPVMESVWAEGSKRRAGWAPAWTTSAELRGEHRLRVAAPSTDLSTTPKWSDALVELVAWFWTEGSVNSNGSSAISQSETVNAENVARIRGVLTELFGPAPTDEPVRSSRLWHASRAGQPAWSNGRVHENGVRHFKLNGPATAVLLAAAPDMVVSREFVLSLTRSQLDLFIDVSIAADGTIPRDGYAVITQKRREMLECVELACILTGRFTVLTRCATTGKSILRISRRDRVSHDPTRTNTIVPYTGTVWCPTTPSGTWMARRNGTVYFTGNSLPEIHYPARFLGSALSRFTLHVARVDPDRPNDPPVIPQPDDKTPLFRVAEDVLRGLEGESGGHPEILRRFAINMTVAADCWLFGEDKASETDWEILSVQELRADGVSGGLSRYRYGSTGIPEPVPTSGVFTNRFWIAHPGASSLADGALEALGEDCKRLLALNESITSRLLSRLSQAGILFLPNTLSIPGDVTQPDGTDQGPGDPFFRKMLATMERAIRERGSAAGSIPIIVRGPAGEGEHIVHVKLDRAIDEVEMKLRGELRSNIATGLDLPPEVQSGLGDASHWASWSVMDSTFRSHLIPLADQLTGGLTRVYLRPGVKQVMRRELSIEEARELSTFVVVSDGSEAIARPNAAEDGRALHDRFTISDRALNARSGATEDEAPDEAEYVRQLGRKFNNPYLSVFGLPVEAEIDWSKVDKSSQDAGGAPGVGGTPPSRMPVDNGTPGQGAPGQGDGAGGIADSTG